jgi:hypothetical protein
MKTTDNHDPNKVRAKKCSTCPFRDGSPLEDLRAKLIEQVLTDGNHMCHAEQLQNEESTFVCRGARDIQLQVFHNLGAIKAPTDEAWAEALNAYQDNSQVS